MSCLVFCAGMDLPLPFELFMGWQATCRDVGGTCGFFRTMHGGVSAPSCCAFIHSVAFEEVSGHRVLIKSGPGNRGRSACGTTHGDSLEFPRETGRILRCAGKAGNTFHTQKGNRLSCVIRWGDGAQMKWGRDSRCSTRGNPAFQGTLGVATREPSTVSHFRTEHVTSLGTL